MATPSECPSDSSKLAAIDEPCSEEECRNWCDLPDEVLFRIALCLDWRTHLSRLRGVCPAWRSSLSLSNFPTIRSLPVPPINPDLPDDLLLLPQRFYFLSPRDTARQCGSESSDPLSGRWLARMAEIGTNKWHLLNPLNIHEYFFSFPPISGSINHLDCCQITELTLVFSLISGSESKAKPIAKKVVDCIKKDSEYHLAVLALLERENGGGLFLYRLSDKNWVSIEENNDEIRILDIAAHKGKFYAFDLSGWRVGLIDPDNPSSPMEFISAPGIVGDPIDGMYTVTFDDCLYFLGDLHFVPSNGRLYLVVQLGKLADESEKSTTMVVFMLKKEEGDHKEGYSWEQVKSLDDHIFFIGYDASFSLPSSSTNLPQWKPNAICLFTHPFPMLFDGCYKDEHGKMPGRVEHVDSVTYARYWLYFGIFSLGEEEQGVVPFKKLPKRAYTGLFFPPPAWVKWRCPSLDNMEVRIDGLKFGDLRDRPFKD